MTHSSPGSIAIKPVQVADAEVIECAQFERLLAMAGPAFAFDLIMQLQSDLLVAQRGLMAAAYPLDWPAVRMQSHVVMGLAGTIGAGSLQDVAQRLNDLCHHIRRDEILACAVLAQAVQALQATLPILAKRAQLMRPPE